MSDQTSSKRPLYIPYAGSALLETPLLNKGSAFTEFERQQFNLEGLLPRTIESIEEQMVRCYQQLQHFDDDLDKHIYLRNIQDTNETLFCRLVTQYTEEIMPLIYTPTVGAACQEFSKIYRRKRGLFISYPDRDRIEDMLQNATKHNVKVIVVTDGERILGLGDQGIGGMGIPIGKLSLYTACGGISPAYTLPVVLDVGSNNQELLDDPMYMGWRHERISGDEYYEFVDQFIQAVKRRWPEALLQFEDFAATNATPLLEKYRDELCCFNDDIQGTASVTVGTLLAACKNLDQPLKDQRVLFLGAGSAGCGIAEQIIAQMKREGLSDSEARERIALIDSRGLLVDDLDYLKSFQSPLAQKAERVKDWPTNDKGRIDFMTTLKHARPTVLVGVSGQPDTFNEEVVRTMSEFCERPVILPLSNPTSKAEGIPADILRWTDGKAIVATGSPFEPVELNGKQYPIAQCNNSYIFPGVGLGVISVKAQRVTDNMLMAASEALAQCSPLATTGEGPLLPALSTIREVSKFIAKAVAKQAMDDDVAVTISDVALEEKINKNFWEPNYRNYRRTSF
ncbi:NAD-dependent malic enzyme [Pleionea sp. CnH1-48]|uniref:NAD-dependent malic enzyme n=1 Tax=Pleionea sp. CnH1-48 TaxID=2954494 RepID=UPI00209809D1|nr:NAD-dependent malic enzyme [Pleionea sp. CnH1-48]MCO7224815.1 NAD-dependent malic enzyme [Pleionea sp. CnH1-48]